MAVRHTVRRGDSLWSLANRYLGSGTRWREIFDEHNKAASRSGPYNAIHPIEEPNLIFVGQTVMIPPQKKHRGKEPQPLPRPEPKSKGTAIPLNFEITYAIGKDTPPAVYVQSYVDYTVKAEMSGTIDIQIESADRYRHSLELLMSKSPTELKQKLYDAYDPAVRALIAKPELVFESGRLRIDAPIAAEANAGPFIFEVQAVNPTTMAGIIKPNPISSSVNVAGRKYKYLAKIEFKAEVIGHPMPKSGPYEMERMKEPLKEYEGNESRQNWRQSGKDVLNVAVKVTIATAIAFSILARLPQVLAARMSRISMPIIYGIDPNDPRNRGYARNNEA